MRLCVPVDVELRRAILTEVHSNTYATHSYSKKMYCDLKVMYWLPRLKRDVMDFIGGCLVC